MKFIKNDIKKKKAKRKNCKITL